MSRLPMYSDPDRQARAYDVVLDASAVVATRQRWYWCATCEVSLHGPEGIYIERRSEGKYAKHAACGSVISIPEEVPA